MSAPKSLRWAWDIVGGLSNPSKMPCRSYGLPASRCNVGSKLARIAGTICSLCYALSGRYVMPCVQAAQSRRLTTIDHPFWSIAMAALITWRARRDGPYWRWHDSGDVQSVAHWRAIFAVCRMTPHVTHWLPTRELALLTMARAQGEAIPPNLRIRFSATKIGALPILPDGVLGSTAHPDKGSPPDGAVECRAYTNKGACGDCRLCWDSSVPVISYPLH